MQIVGKYSHLNGEEFLLARKPKLWKEVQEVIRGVDAEECKKKVSQEIRSKGEVFYSPPDMNEAFEKGFTSAGWKEERLSFWAASEAGVLRKAHNLPAEEQKTLIEEAGLTPIRTSNQIDFVKDRVAVEVQFGKYPFVAHDLFVKLMSFFVSDMIDVGIEIVPMKEMIAEMSSGVAYYERDLLNMVRQGRSVPAVPLLLLGVAP